MNGEGYSPEGPEENPLPDPPEGGTGETYNGPLDRCRLCPGKRVRDAASLSSMINELEVAVKETPQITESYMCHEQVHCYGATDWETIRVKFRAILSREMSDDT